MSSESKERLNLEKVQNSYAELLKELKGMNRHLSQLPDPFQVYDKTDLQNRMIGIREEFRNLKDNFNNVLSPKEWQAFEQGLNDLITPIQEKIGNTARNFQEEIEEDSEALIEPPFETPSEDVKTETNRNTPRQLYTKDSKIEQDLEDHIRGIDQAAGIDKKKLRAEMEAGYSDYRITKSIPESIDSAMDRSGLKELLNKVLSENNAAIRSNNSNKVESKLSEVIKLKGELNSTLTALPRQMSDAQSAYYYVIKVAISEVNKMESTLHKELKAVQAIEHKQVREAIKGMLEKGHNLDPLISRRDPNSPHKKFMEEFNSIEAKIADGQNPAIFLDRLNKMKAQLEATKPNTILGARNSAVGTVASVSARASVQKKRSEGGISPPPIFASHRSSTRITPPETNISIDVSQILDSINKFVNPTSIQVEIRQAVATYNSLKTELLAIHPGSTVNDSQLQNDFEAARSKITEAMGFRTQIAKIEKLVNNSELQSNPTNIKNLLAEVSKVKKLLESEIENLAAEEKKLGGIEWERSELTAMLKEERQEGRHSSQKSKEIMVELEGLNTRQGHLNKNRLGAAIDTIDVALIKLDQLKSQLVQKLPAKEREAEETRHFKLDLSTKK